MVMMVMAADVVLEPAKIDRILQFLRLEGEGKDELADVA